MDRSEQQKTMAPTTDNPSEMPTHTVPEMHGISPSDSTGSREGDAADKKNKAEEPKMDKAKGKTAKDAPTKGCLADSWERVERALAQGDGYFFKKYPQLKGPPNTEGACYACVLLKLYEQDGSI